MYITNGVKVQNNDLKNRRKVYPKMVLRYVELYTIEFINIKKNDNECVNHSILCFLNYRYIFRNIELAVFYNPQ